MIRGSSPGGVAGPTGLLLDGADTGGPGSDYARPFFGFGSPPVAPPPPSAPALRPPARAVDTVPDMIIKPFQI